LNFELPAPNEPNKPKIKDYSPTTDTRFTTSHPGLTTWSSCHQNMI